MTKIVIILSEDGTFQNILGDSEVDVSVFRKGEDDREIDIAESQLTEVEWIT